MGGNDDEEAKRVYVACVACTREAGEAAAEGAATAAGGVGNTQSAALHPSSLAVSLLMQQLLLSLRQTCETLLAPTRAVPASLSPVN